MYYFFFMCDVRPCSPLSVRGGQTAGIPNAWRSVIYGRGVCEWTRSDIVIYVVVMFVCFHLYNYIYICIFFNKIFFDERVGQRGRVHLRGG